MMTKTNKIGVVGSHPIPEIIRNINKLTIGAKSVNPDVEVSVVWINSWFDPPKDMDASKFSQTKGTTFCSLLPTHLVWSLSPNAEKEFGRQMTHLWDNLDQTVTSLV